MPYNYDQAIEEARERQLNEYLDHEDWEEEQLRKEEEDEMRREEMRMRRPE